MKKSYVLFAVLSLIIFKGFAQPGTPAPSPTANAANVISLWGNSYTNVSGTNWFPNWGQPTQVSYLSVGGDTTLEYTALSYEGVAFSSPLDISNMDSVHFDIWSSNCTSLDIRLINSTAVQSSGSAIQPDVPVTLNNAGWNRISIPISKFTGLELSLVDQMSFTGLVPTSGVTIYLENIYFVSHVNIPTITGFSVPSNLLLGAAPFTLTPPTSNSTGAFSYTSSDPTVATISGNVVTIVGAGTTVITANQASAGSYSKGSISATLVVSYPPPTTSAPAPTQNPNNVVSLWGNTYYNVAAGINWFPGWGQSTQLSLLNVGGDTTLEYSALNYEGVQLTDSIDVSKADSLHFDIWTPNCTSIGINLINSALVTGGAAIQVADTVTLTKSGWNSISIPLSAFNGVKLNEIDQLMFTGVNPANGGVVYLQNIYFWGSELLSVNIANLKAEMSGSATIISWETLSEKNNKGFEVERSNDGTNWTSVQFVNSKGNTSSINKYSVVDNNTSKGINYYRLAETDLIGKINYSNVVSVNFSNTSSNFLFYPNPVKDVLTVSLQTIQNHFASLSLTSVDGKTVKTIQLSSGNSNSSVSFNVSGIAKGIYLLTLRDGNTIKSSKVLIN